MKLAMASVLACLLAAPAAAHPHHHIHAMRHAHRAHVSVPRRYLELKGSRQVMARENLRANQEHIARLRERDLVNYKDKKLLVQVPSNKMIVIDKRLPAANRYLRPEARAFLVRLAAAHYGAFHRPVRLTSAVRSVEYQENLRLRNGNAARAGTGLDQSLHLTGFAFDLSKLGMSTAEVGWMQVHLIHSLHAGQSQTTEEQKQSVFHIVALPPLHTKKGGHAPRALRHHHGPPH